MVWIQWNHILPRITLFSVVILVVEFGVGPGIHWAIVSHGEKVVGAKVDVTSATASVVGAYVSLQGIQITDTDAPQKNLVEADQLDLKFETKALLQKKAIVSHGKLRGLRFGALREKRGDLSINRMTGRPSAESIHNRTCDVAANWFSTLDKKFSEDLTPQFQSVRVADRLVARWPEQYNQVESRAKGLQLQVDRLQADVERAQANPLRHVTFLHKLPTELQAVDRSFVDLRAEVELITEQLGQDRRVILAACKRDETLLCDKLDIETIDPAVLTSYFLRQPMSGPVTNILAWMDWVHHLPCPTARGGAGPKLARQQGQEIFFVGCQKVPDLLIRSLEVDGALQIDRQPIKFVGEIHNLTSEPAVHGQPVRVEIVANGDLKIRLVATLDRTEKLARDEIEVSCRGLQCPGVRLGRADSLQMDFAPSSADVNLHLKVVGNELSGNIFLEQPVVETAAQFGDSLVSSELEMAVANSLHGPDPLATRVTFSGTLDKPAWEVSSNLGPAVYRAVQLALDHAVRAKVEKLASQSAQDIDERLGDLNALATGQMTELLSQIEAPQNKLKRLAAPFLGGRDGSVEQLGHQRPGKSVLR
ncbi:MAG: TIGR03545 family protein [Pirellulales bacterium]|jgi:uncharacterized protein (TIGR03545 family)|nr:TIGR03545 family protein [Pirellulales bacterium]